MKLIRSLLLLSLFLVILAIAWCWWNWPRRVDMAQYAPAEALVYIECNDLPRVAKSISESDAWKSVGTAIGLTPQPASAGWLSKVAALGIGPAESVILSRAQVAVVMLSLDAAEENTTLKIRPEGAIIVDTHTTSWRMRPAVERALMRFAESMYGAAEPKRYREDADYLEWAPATGDRRIIAAIEGSLVIVGNSKRAVQTCLDTHRGRKPALRSDSSLTAMRTRVSASDGLAFGYISAGNATKLFSWGLPMLFGREPGDSNLEQLLTNRAARVLGAVGWSSRAISGGIEDRFFLALEPPVIERLKPVFKTADSTSSLWGLLPDQVESVTLYKSEEPARAWDGVRNVTAQLDALSAVVFGSVMKAALVPYGIEDAERFLKAVGPGVATVKLREGTGSSVLFARVRDRGTLEQMFPASDSKSLEVAGKKFATAFIEDSFIIGPPDDVRIWLTAREAGKTLAAEGMQRLTRYPTESSSGIVTHFSDEDRVRDFFAGIVRIQNVSKQGPVLEGLNDVLSNRGRLPFAVTETSLLDQGIERRTRSAFGQFSTLVSLLRRE